MNDPKKIVVGRHLYKAFMTINLYIISFVPILSKDMISSLIVL